MAWTLASIVFGKPTTLADITYDTDKEQVTIKSVVTDTVVVINCNWVTFCKLVDLNGYHINYAFNIITVSDDDLDPTGEQSDFEIIFSDVDWFIVAPSLSFFEKIKKLLYDTFAWCAAITF
jgi:hypothetical protein